ncbi:MAG TPA: C-terminal helicase domain-containing protein, partial [Candidatus Thermoplasmatota archaeon]|nr:C-terminal helicase domain-containing protein [Candidatus Thermoplasmatota archaeon]
LDALKAAGLEGEDGVGVVVPHRAQKAALRDRHPWLAEAGAVDTVERFQGDERDVILVTATASDPEYVAGEAEFLLNPNRLNVALSRPRKKLIVVASRSVFRHLPRDPDLFESAGLWKRLRYQYAAEPLWQGHREGVQVRVTGKRAENAGDNKA